MSSARKFRITLWDIGTNGWRGDQKAVVFDASAIGVEEHANDVGSAFWTLHNAHPQIAEFVPLARHYEISRWSYERDRWEFVGAGMLNDYTVTEFETTFAGLDYKNILNQTFTPLLNMDVTSPSSINTKISISANTSDRNIQWVSVENSADTTIKRFISTSAISISPITTKSYAGNMVQVSSTSEGIYTNDPDGTVSYWKTPGVNLSYKIVYNSTTTANLEQNMYMRLYAYPAGSRDHGEPPLDRGGLIGQWYQPNDGNGPTVNGTTWTVNLNLYTEELEKAMTAAGYTHAASHWVNSYQDMTLMWPNPLKNGVTYSFQIYAAIYRSSGAGTWFRTDYGRIMGATDTTLLSEVTVGQSKDNASVLVSNVFSNSLADSTFQRLRYSTLSVSGSTSTSHTVFSAGEPLLDHISAICDLEMGAKTNGDKVIFGINKPTGGASYDGTFKLNLSVSSTASTAMALRYPENIKAFSFSPGYSRVRNDVTVIPTTNYLAGTSGQSDGVSVIGATAVDNASISSIGRIKLLAPKGGLVNASAASNEANRLLTTYKPANTKQANIAVVLDGVDLWNGWDVGDSIRLTIKRGLADIDEPFVISGVRWFGESDGHERVELDLVQGSAFNAAFTAPTGSSGSSNPSRNPSLPPRPDMNIIPRPTQPTKPTV